MLKTYVRGFIKLSMGFINSLYLVKIFAGEFFNIYRKRGLYKDVELNEKQVNEVQSLWKRHYGKEISVKWHRLYQSYNGEFNKNYFPEIFVTTKLERKLNDREIGKIISDKSFLPMFYRDIKDVRLPKTYVMNNSGVFYTADRNIITREMAIAMIEDIGECIIKPTLDSSSGDSVNLCDFHEGTDLRSGRSADEIIHSYDENFLVQEKIIPNHELKELYPHSINTLRVITYLVEDKIAHTPVTLSMGRDGNHVDNIQAGGVSVAVSDEGELYREGFTHFQEVHRAHPDTGTVFENVKLPRVEDVIKVAKEMHEKTPHMKIISWDFTLDVNDDIVLLELNVNGMSVWFPQMVSGKAIFGENTEKMIGMLKK